MGAIEMELMELNRLYEALPPYKKGDLTKEQLDMRISILSQKEKRYNTLLTAHIAAAKHGVQGKKVLGRLAKINMLGNGTFIEISDDRVHCEDQNLLLTREECLARSGNSETFESCQACETNKATRRIVFSKPEYKD